MPHSLFHVLAAVPLRHELYSRDITRKPTWILPGCCLSFPLTALEEYQCWMETEIMCIFHGFCQDPFILALQSVYQMESMQVHNPTLHTGPASVYSTFMQQKEMKITERKKRSEAWRCDILLFLRVMPQKWKRFPRKIQAWPRGRISIDWKGDIWVNNIDAFSILIFLFNDFLLFNQNRYHL